MELVRRLGLGLPAVFAGFLVLVVLLSELGQERAKLLQEACFVVFLPIVETIVVVLDV